MCNEVKLSKEKLQKAYKEADNNGKKLLESLYGDAVRDSKPNLDDYKSIKTYEDACVALGIEPIATTDENDHETVVSFATQHFLAPKHLVALHKLETISRALWGRTFQPKPDGKGNEVYWYPWFCLFTKQEVERMNAKDRGALLSAAASTGADAGFGSLYTIYRSSHASAYIGFRLCQETDEKARYFGHQFLELWAEYLRFNFTTGERLK